MSYKLVVSFTGMCLFVPAPNDDSGNPRMHVLLPQMDDMTGMPAHEAKLFWDLKYGSAGGSGLNQGVDLTGAVVDLTSLGSAPPDLLVWPEIAAADIAYSGKVHKDKTKKKVNEVRTRVSMQSGAITCVQRGDVWTMPIKKGNASLPVKTRMGWWADWTIDGLNAPLPLALIDAATGATTSLDTLNPVSGMIQLYVYHVPTPQLPPNPVLPKRPARGTPAPHFPGFKKLLTTPADDFTPTYEGATADASPPCTGVFIPKPQSGSSSIMKAAKSQPKGESYTCMLGQAGIG